ncbi:hypothetical protein G5C66_15400 [Nocardioides sp. KC13]|uniref:Uncharacterized protein n=1 Tax=Nocardioides turkmenicus TaxID=2711220 RepID=A0A6M1R314_9ACTN|nr:hypothetical protein [Nocardioides sp. KC13]NGN94122.1 hypothetical protein [Nocardioides sp. KC13]
MKNMTHRRRTAFITATAALLAGSLTMVGAGASPAAAAGAVNCSGTVIGKAGGYLRYRNVRNSTVTKGYRSPSTVSWNPRSWISYGGAGGGNTWMSSFIVPSTDGRGRDVTLHGDTTTSVLTKVTVKQLYRTSGAAVTGWTPRKVVNGPTSAVYTVSDSGAVSQMKIVYNSSTYDYRLGAAATLPVRFGSSKTVAGVWTRNSSGVLYNILYSINSSTNKLEQIIVRPDRPAEAKKYVVRSINAASWRYLSVHNCWDDAGMVAAKDIVLINPTTGNAVRLRQSSGLGHSTTFSAPVRVGTDGTWKWSGISS